MNSIQRLLLALTLTVITLFLSLFNGNHQLQVFAARDMGIFNETPLDSIGEDLYNTYYGKLFSPPEKFLTANVRSIMNESVSNQQSQMLITISQNLRALFAIIDTGFRSIVGQARGFYRLVAERLSRSSYSNRDNSGVNDQGLVVFPASGNHGLDSATVAKIAETFSDEIIIVPGGPNSPPVIKPVFRDSLGDDYLYLVVPLGQ